MNLETKSYGKQSNITKVGRTACKSFLSLFSYITADF